jgi:transaldolase
MFPTNLHSKIFLDGGDPAETKQLMDKLGFLDGQTTNPTLISKNPEAVARLAAGNKFSKDEVYVFYKNVVGEIGKLIPSGSVSIEVYADENTDASAMVAQGKEMYKWIPNAHIKLPITKAGLAAAEELVKEGIRVNMTLCFSEAQAAAVYAATRGAVVGQVYVSPFVGRLDDVKQNGMSLIENIIRLFKTGDGHVQVLTASVRSQEHFLRALQLGSHIITAPYKMLAAWAEGGVKLPDSSFVYSATGLESLVYQDLDLNKPWQSFAIDHPLTAKGIERFTADWNTLIL